jgi:hypothetical protein
MDAAVSYSYLDDSYRHARDTATQAIALLPQVARPSANREDVMAAAVSGGSGIEPFEKDGYLWVDNLGLRFDDKGRLIAVRARVDPL